MKWKIFIFLELSSCVVLCGICFWWLLPFVLIFGTLNDLFSPIERMLLARMSELTCFLYCVNIVNMTQIATMVLWHAWHWSNMPTNIRDIQCLDKTDQNTIIPASRCNNSPFPHLTRTTVSLDPLLSVLKQFVGIFTIFLVWVFELSLDLSKRPGCWVFVSSIHRSPGCVAASCRLSSSVIIICPCVCYHNAGYLLLFSWWIVTNAPNLFLLGTLYTRLNKFIITAVVPVVSKRGVCLRQNNSPGLLTAPIFSPSLVCSMGHNTGNVTLTRVRDLHTHASYWLGSLNNGLLLAKADSFTFWRGMETYSFINPSSY